MAVQNFPSQPRQPAERIIGPLTIPVNPKSAELVANIAAADAAVAANSLEMVCETSADGFAADIHMEARIVWTGNVFVKGVLWQNPRLFVQSNPEQAGREVRFRITNNNAMTFGGTLTTTAAA